VRLFGCLNIISFGASAAFSVESGASALVLAASLQATVPNNKTPLSKKVVNFFIFLVPIWKW
jgi:hypothetical protein